MTEVKIQVDGAHARMAEKAGRLTTGMVGAVARFSFDRVWDGLTKVAVFKGSGVTRDVLQWDGDAVKIPAEVLREEGDLFVGVEGHNADGSLVIPTVWTDRINVLCGANASGDHSVNPTLPVWAQLDSKMGDLALLQTKDKASLVAAINEILRSGGGSVDEATVERIVEAYLAENPPESGTKIHVGPEPPEDGSTLWLDTNELGEKFVPAPALPEVGKYLRVTEVDADGKIVATETVGTDTSLSVSGDPADALVTGNNIKNIGKTLNAIEKVSRYMTTSEWALSIDSTANTVTVPSGMLACNNWCMALTEQTVDIAQEDATTLVVYDSSAGAVRSVRFTDYTGKIMYVIAVITRDRYAEPNANWVQGPYLVDGVMVGGADVEGCIPAPATAQVGQTIVVKEVDESGKPTAWGTVDMESGGSSDTAPLPLLADVTSEEALSIFEVVLSKRAVKRVLMQITIPASEAVGGPCYGRMNGKLWDAYIFGSTALAANACKWLELDFMEGNLAKFMLSNSNGNLWAQSTINTCGKFEPFGYCDSIGIAVGNPKTAPAGTRIQVWGE